LEEKRARLGEEPDSRAEGVVQIVFRKPTGKERIARKFLKTDAIQRLYDYIDLMREGDPNNNLGFEIAADGKNKDAEIEYELVTAP
jgi:hypothetical protein